MIKDAFLTIKYFHVKIKLSVNWIEWQFIAAGDRDCSGCDIDHYSHDIQLTGQPGWMG
jgi:hypothetical protein